MLYEEINVSEFEIERFLDWNMMDDDISLFFLSKSVSSHDFTFEFIANLFLFILICSFGN